ncbi:hypothetical protein G6550_15705 [Azonexus fungiphilus]|nr:hypothetical protein [Azonexus fungiphilus]
MIDPKSVGFFREWPGEQAKSIAHRPDLSRIIPIRTRIFRVAAISSRGLNCRRRRAHNAFLPHPGAQGNTGNLMAIKFICRRLANNPGILPAAGRSH